MVSIRRKILDKGNVVQEQLVRILQRHEDALANSGAIDSKTTISDITDADTVEAVISYANGDTDTVNIVIQKSN